MWLINKALVAIGAAGVFLLSLLGVGNKGPVAVTSTNNNALNGTAMIAGVVGADRQGTSTPSTAQKPAPAKPAAPAVSAPAAAGAPVVAVPSAPAAASTPGAAPAPNSAPAFRNPITARLADEQALANDIVAVVCAKPLSAGDPTHIGYGTGVIVNKNGYILTNEHVVAGYDSCFVGRRHVVPKDFYSRGPLPAIALYYSVKIVGTGKGVTDPSNTTQASSMHDFAVLKIDKKMPPRSEWQSDQATLVDRSLSMTFIPWATDAEYAQFPQSGPFPAVTINFTYQPVRGDLLSMGGFIADATIPTYTFNTGNVGVFSSSTIGVAFPTAEGLSGSPVVDDQGNMVALNWGMDCGARQGCYDWNNTNSVGFNTYTYGNQGLALPVPFIDQAMKQDLGFSLRDLVNMQ